MSDFKAGIYTHQEGFLEELKSVKPGDRLTRVLGQTAHMTMVVRSVGNGVIICDAITEKGDVFHGGWTFSQENGGEIDEDLGWFPPTTPTGSILTNFVSRA